MNDLIDQELKDEFFREFIELSHDVEACLLKLEQEPGNLNHVRELFRPFHTIKGNSGLINEAEILRISQLAESVLDEVRQGKQKLTEEMLEVSLSSIDVIRDISRYRDARPLMPRVEAVVSELQSILDSFEKPKAVTAEIKPYSLLNKTIGYRLSVTDAISFALQIEVFTSIVDKMRYQRIIFDFLPDLFDCVLELSFIISNHKPLDNISKILKYTEMYLIVLNLDDSTEYSFEKWELIAKLRDDLMQAVYSMLIDSLGFKILYYNEDDNLDDLNQMIGKYLDQDYNFVIVNLNVHHPPSKNEITTLVQIIDEYNEKITLVQRYLGQNEYWHSLSLLIDGMPLIAKNFWKAIFETVKKLKEKAV